MRNTYIKPLLLSLMMLPSILSATPNNMFIIKDQDGNVIKGKKLEHTENDYFANLIKEQNEILDTLKVIKEQQRDEKQESSSDDLLIEGDYDKDEILKNAKTHLGENYVWGGTKPNAFDCSGYVQYLYKKEGVLLPRTAYEQSQVGKPISKEKLQKGDLLFFLTDKSRGIPVTHVGMYIGGGKFIHAASSKKGIIITPLKKSKYNRLFVKATRIIK